MNDIYGQTCNYEYFLNNEEEIKQNAYNIADPTSLGWGLVDFLELKQ